VKTLLEFAGEHPVLIVVVLIVIFGGIAEIVAQLR
jgi:hypothetical protein